jgi:hypothetical protein
MPGRDGTGPLGLGPGSFYRGTGLGAGSGLGMRGRSCGWRACAGFADWTGTSKERLILRKEQLQRQIDLIDRQIDNR